MKDVLKQSTAVVVSFGPMVDKADGITLKTGLVSALDHASTGIMLSKNGGTITIRHATVTASTYDAHGCYKVTLDTTDVGTLGSLRVIYTDATTCLPVWRDFTVLPAMIYDSLVAGTDRLDTNVTHINDVAASSVTTISTHIGTTGASTAQTADNNTLLTAVAAYLDTEVAAILAAVDTEVADIRTRVLLALPPVAYDASGGLRTSLQGARTWYLAASGGSDGASGLSRSAPLATIAQALTNASDGDTIHLLAGTYSGAVTVSKRITLEGARASTVTLTHNSGATVTIGNLVGITLRDLAITSTDSAGGIAISDMTGNAGSGGLPGGVTYERLDITSPKQGIVMQGQPSCTIRGCSFQCEEQGVNVYWSSVTLEDCFFAISGTAGNSTTVYGIYCLTDTKLHCTNVQMQMARGDGSGSISGDLVNIRAETSSVYLENCYLEGGIDGLSGSTGIAYGLQNIGSNSELHSTWIATSNTQGATLSKDILNTTQASGGFVHCFGSKVSKTKVTGTGVTDITFDGRPAIRRFIPQAGTSTTITLDSGASSVNDVFKGRLFTQVAGTGAGQALHCASYNGTTKAATMDGTFTTTPTTSTYWEITSVIPTILGTPAGASVSADIAAKPTAAQNAAAVRAELTTELGRIDVATSSVSGGGGTVSAANVDKDHTWKFDNPSQVTAPNIISEVIGFIGLVAIDFDQPMPARSSISSITSAAFANDAGTEPTVTSSAMSTDKKKVLVLINASAATAGTYTISVKIVTTDSQTFVRKGRITLG